MVREALSKQHVGMNKHFRFRGEEPGRLENFSDACFALAITLLLISTSAPTNFQQIKKFVWEFIPFCATIVLIVLVWYEHFIFYYRYGLRNSRVIVLNTVFLIIVLFYVYPLKFLWKFLLLSIFARAFNEQTLLVDLQTMFNGEEDISEFMIIYGLGASAIFLVLMLMYRYALRNTHLLELNRIEEFDTRHRMYSNLIMGSIPLLSALLAYIFKHSPHVGRISGFTYFLYMPAMFFYNFRIAKRRKKLLDVTIEG